MEAPNPKYLHKNKDFFILIGLSRRWELVGIPDGKDNHQTTWLLSRGETCEPWDV